MGNSLHFNGVDLSGSSYGLTVLRGAHPFMAAPRSDVKALGTRQGGYAQGGFSEPREFTVPCVIQGTSNDDLDDKLDALRLLLDPRNGEKSIRFDHQPDRYFLGRLAGAVEWEYLGTCHAQLELAFRCADPGGWATSETVQSFTIESDPDTLAAPASGVVAGTDYARPVWKLRNMSGSSASVIVLQNTTTGEQITSTYTVPNNHWIRFDTERERLQYSGDDTNWVDIMASLSTSSKLFPRLKPGVSNALAVTGLTAGTLTITYRARFL